MNFIISGIGSAISAAVSWIFRLSTIKFVIFGALSLVLTPLMALLMSLVELTNLNGIPSLVNALPSGLLFYVKLFRLDVGLPLLVGAYLTRFFIRRLPVVG